MPNHECLSRWSRGGPKMPNPSLTKMGQTVDFDTTEHLHIQLSNHLTQLLGEEVTVSKQEALFIATVVWTGTARPPQEFSQVKP
jgi:hypothetical protein